jgi:magnesium-transporting ATPase (P-type)
VCNDIFSDEQKENKNEIIYQGYSPDEVSLVKGAALLGYKYKSKNNGELTIEDEIHEVIRHYEVKL